MNNDNNNPIRIVSVKQSFSGEVSVRCSNDAAQVMRDILTSMIPTFKIGRQLAAVYLNTSNKAMCVEAITTDSKEARIDTKGIVKEALAIGATAVIIGHNRPSGTMSPTEADKRETKKLKGVLDTLGISLLDNIILTSSAKYSFADNAQRSLA